MRSGFQPGEIWLRQMKSSLRLDEIAAEGGGYGVPAGRIKI